MKSSLRSTCLERRDAIPPDQHEAMSFAVCEQLVRFLSGQNISGKCIALYNPIKSELDVTPVLHALDAEGIVVALPVVDNAKPELAFFRFQSTLALREGAFGVLEPERFEEVTPDIVIVPLVGFDRYGHRLGYGKGYYDATLRALRVNNETLLAIGVAFSAQEVDNIPAMQHDEKLDIIITESELLKPAI